MCIEWILQYKPKNLHLKATDKIFWIFLEITNLNLAAIVCHYPKALSHKLSDNKSSGFFSCLTRSRSQTSNLTEK